MTANYDFFKSKFPPAFLPGLVNSAGGCSRERLARAKSFFSEPAHNVSGTDKELIQVAEEVEDCARLREREGASVAAYLERFAPRAGTERSPGTAP